MSNTPAIDFLLSSEYKHYGPGGYSCEECPFALAGPMDADMKTPFDRQPWGGWNGNSDASEAYYKCGLPGSYTASLDKVWGEYPKCTIDEWRAVAREELKTL